MSWLGEPCPLGVLVFKLYTPSSFWAGVGCVGGGNVCSSDLPIVGRAWGLCQSTPLPPFGGSQVCVAAIAGLEFLPQRKGLNGRIQLESEYPSLSHWLSF